MAILAPSGDPVLRSVEIYETRIVNDFRESLYHGDNDIEQEDINPRSPKVRETVPRQSTDIFPSRRFNPRVDSPCRPNPFYHADNPLFLHRSGDLDRRDSR